MTSLIRFLAAASIVLVAFLALSDMRSLGGVSARLDEARKRHEQAAERLSAAEEGLRQAKAAAEDARKAPVPLRSVVSDFLLMISEMPQGFKASAAPANRGVQSISSAVSIGALGVPSLPLVVNIGYDDYTAAVAIVVSWFAESELPITLDRLVFSRAGIVLNVTLYGTSDA